MNDPQNKGRPGWQSYADDLAADPGDQRKAGSVPQSPGAQTIEQLDAAIRSFEQAKAYALHPATSDEDRQRALGIARHIGGHLQAVGYEYGEANGWPYVKATPA